MAPYIDGLVEMEGNSVDEWGVSCTWTMAEGETDWANAREVDLAIVPSEFGNEKPDPAALEGMGDTTLLEDAWVDGLGGIAYSFEMSTGVVAGIATTVWTPEYEVTVSGGRWENQPALDGTAALDVAKRVFG